MLLDLLSKEPNDVFLTYALGIEYLSELDLADAEKHFKKTLLLNPDYIAAYYQLGKLYESQLKNSDALRFFKEGLDRAIRQKNNKAVNEFNEAIFMLED
ncbi:MAG: hypothetical protein JWO32_3107 [Bacteroidetes bacterium]|nr:hypothetical protein [Bacteroidota bacterium]